MENAIVGFDFTRDELLSGEIVPLRSGLTVVYGLNGAGKSRLLNAMKAALLGIQSDTAVSIIARVLPPAHADLSADSHLPKKRKLDRGPGLLLALAGELADRTDFDAIGQEGGSEFRTVSLGRALELVNEEITSRARAADPVTTQNIVSEVLRDRYFLLFPTGTAEAPSWDAWPAADISQQAIADERARVYAVWSHIEQMLSGIPDSARFNPEVVAVYEAQQELIAESPFLIPDESDLPARKGFHTAPADFVALANGAVEFQDFQPIALHGTIDFGLDLLEIPADVTRATIDYLNKIVSLAAKSLYSGYGQATWAELSDRYGFDQTDAGLRRNEDRDLNSLLQRRAADLSAYETEVVRKIRDESERIVREVAAHLERQVNEMMTEMLPDPPVVSLETSHSVWPFQSGPANWKFRRRDAMQRGVGLDNLSRAERGWAEHAIAEAIYWHRRDVISNELESLRPLVALIDEPEAGLHRAAEANAARALVRQAQDPRRIVVTATHSPELLNSRLAEVIEVKRGAGIYGKSHVHRFTMEDRNSLLDMGLTVSDLLRWPRIFLLVEGEHDEIVLDAFLGQRLRTARVEILPMRGGTKLAKTIDSRVLFDFTDAHVVALLDNQRVEAIDKAWQAANVLLLSGLRSEAIDAVLSGLGRESAEAEFMGQWLAGAITHGLESRVTPWGLEARDVIEYLPIGRVVVSDQHSWTALRAAHAQARKDKPTKTAKDFKQWLKDNHRADFSPENLRNSIDLSTPVPPEFERLMKHLEASSLKDA
ncbi:MAG: hypothetical protein H7248_04325 [Microbacteriaceae bacterium]|nr:hypothetical protein [Microbacteriaceae bacterium]